MVAAEIMAAVYHALLRRMQADEFRVFEEEYRLTKLEKARHIATQLIKHFLNLRNATFVGF